MVNWEEGGILMTEDQYRLERQRHQKPADTERGES